MKRRSAAMGTGMVWAAMGFGSMLTAANAQNPGQQVQPVRSNAESFECVLDVDQTVELRGPSETRIASVLVRRGDKVRAGQALVQLDASVEQSALDAAAFRATMQGRIETARNRVDYAEKKLTRTTELHRQNYAPLKEQEEAQAESKLATSELREAVEAQELAKREMAQARDILARRTLRSPFDGVVVERRGHPGELADGGPARQPILKLARIDPLRVEAVLPLAMWGRLKVADTATVLPEGLGGRHPARITQIDGLFDAASGTFGVQLAMINPQARLPAGIRCKLEFDARPAAGTRQ
ncbi:efflux RND transporter periplasmic adaptor subunit [Roseateles sp. LYH14W]|uniref:Efflux RND transporter periplasmic adaptor subunit n=1 Tax=Pelomonas parva TaxID=3299032 RepID=A0ABW7FA47_9BURK